MSTDPIPVSVVVSTLDRPRLLARCLDRDAANRPDSSDQLADTLMSDEHPRAGVWRTVRCRASGCLFLAADALNNRRRLADGCRQNRRGQDGSARGSRRRGNWAMPPLVVNRSRACQIEPTQFPKTCTSSPTDFVGPRRSCFWGYALRSFAEAELQTSALWSPLAVASNA